MATLAALLADVYALTNRDDLVAETTAIVKAATLKAHQSDFFPRDIVTGNFAFTDPTLPVQSFNTASLARWRAWSYLQNFDPNTSPTQPTNAQLFDIIAPNNLFDDYEIMKQNIAYQVGMTLNLRGSAAIASLYYGYYRNPDITNALDMGWISDSHPYCIVYEAARVVFKTIGYDEQAAVYRDLVKDQYDELRMSNILVVGM